MSDQTNGRRSRVPGSTALVGGMVTILVAVLPLVGNAIWGRITAEQSSQETKLQSYLNDVGQLLLDNAENSSTTNRNALIGGKTVALVQSLDASRKATTIGFLYDTS